MNFAHDMPDDGPDNPKCDMCGYQPMKWEWDDDIPCPMEKQGVKCGRLPSQVVAAQAVAAQVMAAQVRAARAMAARVGSRNDAV